MTLIEVVLALAVAGFLLTAATSFVVSVSSIWSDRTQRHFFEDHVDGVTEFLRSALQTAGSSIALAESDSDAAATNSGNTPDANRTASADNSRMDVAATMNTEEPAASKRSLRQTQAAPLQWQRLPGSADYEAPLLYFKLNQKPPLFVTEGELPDHTQVEVYLHFTKTEGLSLIWYSLLQEESEAVEDLQRTPISPYVQQLEYLYWDERFEQWESEASPKEDDEGPDGDYLLPRAIQLTFVYDGETQIRTLTIPIRSRHALLF